jgi:hypothetical protein
VHSCHPFFRFFQTPTWVHRIVHASQHWRKSPVMRFKMPPRSDMPRIPYKGRIAVMSMYSLPGRFGRWHFSGRCSWRIVFDHLFWGWRRTAEVSYRAKPTFVFDGLVCIQYIQAYISSLKPWSLFAAWIRKTSVIINDGTQLFQKSDRN